MKGKLILVTGAARSGKSTFAEKLAIKMDKPVAYLATAQVLDEEMAERVKLHVKRRPSTWKTFEESYHLAPVIAENSECCDVWLLDCVTLYISNLLFSLLDEESMPELEKNENYIATDIQTQILNEIDNLILTIKRENITLIAVTNEVGWGLVPPDPLSRAYRDIAGKVNQKLAQAATEVYLVAVGIPVQLKPGKSYC